MLCIIRYSFFSFFFSSSSFSSCAPRVYIIPVTRTTFKNDSSRWYRPRHGLIKIKKENDSACSFIGSLFFADLENEKWARRTKCCAGGFVRIVPEDASKIFACSSRVFTYSSISWCGRERERKKKVSSPSLWNIRFQLRQYVNADLRPISCFRVKLNKFLTMDI